MSDTLQASDISSAIRRLRDERIPEQAIALTTADQATLRELWARLERDRDEWKARAERAEAQGRALADIAKQTEQRREQAESLLARERACRKMLAAMARQARPQSHRIYCVDSIDAALAESAALDVEDGKP